MRALWTRQHGFCALLPIPERSPSLVSAIRAPVEKPMTGDSDDDTDDDERHRRGIRRTALRRHVGPDRRARRVPGGPARLVRGSGVRRTGDAGGTRGPRRRVGAVRPGVARAAGQRADPDRVRRRPVRPARGRRRGAHRRAEPELSGPAGAHVRRRGGATARTGGCLPHRRRSRLGGVRRRHARVPGRHEPAVVLRNAWPMR